MRTSAVFLDGHVESLSAEDFLRDFPSNENATRFPGGGPNDAGSHWIPFLPPYGSGRIW